MVCPQHGIGREVWRRVCVSQRREWSDDREWSERSDAGHRLQCGYAVYEVCCAAAYSDSSGPTRLLVCHLTQ